MNSRYALHPEAFADLDDIRDFIAQKNPDAADRVGRPKRRPTNVSALEFSQEQIVLFCFFPGHLGPEVTSGSEASPIEAESRSASLRLSITSHVPLLRGQAIAKDG